MQVEHKGYVAKQSAEHEVCILGTDGRPEMYFTNWPRPINEPLMREMIDLFLKLRGLDHNSKEAQDLLADFGRRNKNV